MIGGAAALLVNVSTQPVEAAEVIVYKSPTCGCCNEWVDHLRSNGFTVSTRDRSNMQPIKQEFGVQAGLQSCHTATVDGYFIEGHVPAKDIKRLLSEKPEISGLTVPGMPMGSPGMEGHRKDSYAVLEVDPDNNTSVYAQY
ncbi:metal-binding protein [Solemya velum gill symbiont]|uniref:Metal-binding protein n=3 Tax=Solemya velum gill symbiont TaxID=2340 RepID=A0A0B0HB43_SOVGS|nr:DUF411 domain-containing protein [Solemya velum gill symbiont]KHF25104.1 metal-binding protein [Solemya velum gill symbiont]OOY40170.1 metal-binding protein [Solemya velum gill symbiont]OOY46077.1 metal-binding protein [Solemya velum gill symbiont]OOY49969.1 metal-binding protein [Solemya velum gill symbiont]OOY51301.1 metal-binding protein [Solemya velum gill symbiont]